MNTAYHKEQLRSYFDGEGFSRWTHIYSDAPIRGVRKSVREGHARVVATTLDWLKESEGPTTDRQEDKKTRRQDDGQRTKDNGQILDAGCGTGVLAVALAQQGWRVHAVDIAPQMVEATAKRAQALAVAERVEAQAGDLDSVIGGFDAVVCLDVLIHYPAELFAPMVHGLAAKTRGPLIFTYAPRETLLAALHWVGGIFPKPQRRTEIQMIPEQFVHTTLAEAGMQVRRSRRVSVGFYHVALVEAAFINHEGYEEHKARRDEK